MTQLRESHQKVPHLCLRQPPPPLQHLTMVAVWRASQAPLPHLLKQKRIVLGVNLKTKESMKGFSFILALTIRKQLWLIPRPQLPTHALMQPRRSNPLQVQFALTPLELELSASPNLSWRCLTILQLTPSPPSLTSIIPKKSPHCQYRSHRPYDPQQKCIHLLSTVQRLPSAPNKSAFIPYQPCTGCRVPMGNNSFGPIINHRIQYIHHFTQW